MPGLSALSVADVVVKEYEKLLAAIPTMARHMGKLQLDTETMAEGERASARRPGPCRGSLRGNVFVRLFSPHYVAFAMRCGTEIMLTFKPRTSSRQSRPWSRMARFCIKLYVFHRSNPARGREWLIFAGLEKRVRSLVDGYRELNELVEQAPARVSYAASEYAQALGFRPREPPRSAGAIAGDESGQVSQAADGFLGIIFVCRRW